MAWSGGARGWFGGNRELSEGRVKSFWLVFEVGWGDVSSSIWGVKGVDRRCQGSDKTSRTNSSDDSALLCVQSTTRNKHAREHSSLSFFFFFAEEKLPRLNFGATKEQTLYIIIYKSPHTNFKLVTRHAAQ